MQERPLISEMQPIPGTDGYLISACGEHVYSTRRARFATIGNHSVGYKQTSVRMADGKLKVVKVHRLVALAFLPNPEDKYSVNHIDGNKANNHVSNLEWNTMRENLQHASAAGLLGNKRAATLARLDLVEYQNQRQAA